MGQIERGVGMAANPFGAHETGRHMSSRHYGRDGGTVCPPSRPVFMHSSNIYPAFRLESSTSFRRGCCVIRSLSSPADSIPVASSASATFSTSSR